MISHWLALKLYLRRRELLEKIASRKLWAAVASAAWTALAYQLGLPDVLILAVDGVIGTYIAGQSHVDAKKELAKLKNG